MPTANKGGWKTCSRGHKYRGRSFCPVCMPGRARREAEEGRSNRIRTKRERTGDPDRER